MVRLGIIFVGLLSVLSWAPARATCGDATRTVKVIKTYEDLPAPYLNGADRYLSKTGVPYQVKADTQFTNVSVQNLESGEVIDLQNVISNTLEFHEPKPGRVILTYVDRETRHLKLWDGLKWHDLGPGLTVPGTTVTELRAPKPLVSYNAGQLEVVFTENTIDKNTGRITSTNFHKKNLSTGEVQSFERAGWLWAQFFHGSQGELLAVTNSNSTQSSVYEVNEFSSEALKAPLTLLFHPLRPYRPQVAFKGSGQAVYVEVRQSSVSALLKQGQPWGAMENLGEWFGQSVAFQDAGTGHQILFAPQIFESPIAIDHHSKLFDLESGAVKILKWSLRSPQKPELRVLSDGRWVAVAVEYGSTKMIIQTSSDSSLEFALPAEVKGSQHMGTREGVGGRLAAYFRGETKLFKVSLPTVN